MLRAVPGRQEIKKYLETEGHLRAEREDPKGGGTRL